MSSVIEDVKEKFRARIATDGYTNWKDVLEKFKTFDRTNGCYYMLTSNKGKPNEFRSRFLTYDEALQLLEKFANK